MGNQQVRSAMFDVGWFVGALESEGNFSLGVGRGSSQRPVFQIIPRISIANKDPEFIENLARIAREWTLGFRVDAHSNDCRRVSFDGFMRVKKMLAVVGPHLVTKRNRASLVNAFIMSRENAPKVNSPYTKFDLWCFRELRRANNNGADRDRAIDVEVAENLRDYTPGPSEVRWVMI